MSGGPSEAEASTLYIMSYDEDTVTMHRHVVWGGPDQDTYVGEFSDKGSAECFIAWSKAYGNTWKGVRGAP